MSDSNVDLFCGDFKATHQKYHPHQVLPWLWPRSCRPVAPPATGSSPWSIRSWGAWRPASGELTCVAFDANLLVVFPALNTFMKMSKHDVFRQTSGTIWNNYGMFHPFIYDHGLYSNWWLPKFPCLFTSWYISQYSKYTTFPKEQYHQLWTNRCWFGFTEDDLWRMVSCSDNRISWRGSYSSNLLTALVTRVKHSGADWFSGCFIWMTFCSKSNDRPFCWTLN